MDWGFPVGVMASVRSSGPFAFWARVNLQPQALEAHAQLLSPATAEERALESVKCSVGLAGPHERQPDRPCNQVRSTGAQKSSSFRRRTQFGTAASFQTCSLRRRPVEIQVRRDQSLRIYLASFRFVSAALYPRPRRCRRLRLPLPNLLSSAEVRTQGLRRIPHPAFGAGAWDQPHSGELH